MLKRLELRANRIVTASCHLHTKNFFMLHGRVHVEGVALWLGWIASPHERMAAEPTKGGLL